MGRGSRINVGIGIYRSGPHFHPLPLFHFQRRQDDGTHSSFQPPTGISLENDIVVVEQWLQEPLFQWVGQGEWFWLCWGDFMLGDGRRDDGACNFVHVVVLVFVLSIIYLAV